MSAVDAAVPVEVAGEWSATAATSRGSLHVRRGRPNQDAVAVRRLPGGGGAPVGGVFVGGGLVAAVADGHGGSRYVRSGLGASLAVEVACDAVGELLPPQLPANPDELEAFASAHLLPTVVERWRHEVAQDTAARPLTDAERGRLAGAEPLVAYGSTLLVAVVWDGGALAMKLGDGDLLAVGPDGVAWSPVAGDPRLAAGVTTSLCLPGAAGDFRVAALGPSAQPALLLLATDGYGASFAAPTWRERVAADLLTAVRDHGLGQVAAALPAWLADSAGTGGDDASLAVLWRSPVA